jgi:hypothetical protein
MDLACLLLVDAVKRSVRALFARAMLSTVHPITHFDGVVVSTAQLVMIHRDGSRAANF